ncbi:hypothetical protein C7B80_24920 [Cyanosarcina cf. burmensis CCALA 770]|nr:hypothetical protein C7B80_24920 [Cyanosarcina cf. burmensis CCALA 770]
MNFLSFLAQTPQTTDVIQSFTSIIQTIAVIISLVYVSIQIRDGAKAVKSQTYQSIITAYAEIEARIGQDAETARIYHIGCEYPDKLNAEEKIRFTQLICSIFNFFENLHYQYKTGLLEESLWSGWCQLMKNKLDNPGIKEYWQDNSYLYSKDFREYVKSGKCPEKFKIKKMIDKESDRTNF